MEGRTKQATLEDIYMMDEYMATPGVREGLLAKVGKGDPQIEVDEYEGNPAAYFVAPHGERYLLGPVEMASQKLEQMPTLDQKPAEMTAYDPTSRERIAEFLQAGFEGLGVDRAQARRNAQSLIGGESSALPLGLGIADLLSMVSGPALLATAPLYAQEGGRSIESGTQAAQRGDIGQAAMEIIGGALDVAPGVAGAVRGTKAIVKSGKQIKGNK